MRFGVTEALLVGFGSLLSLIGVLGFGVLGRNSEIYEQMVAAQLAYEETDKAVRDLPADIHLTGILVRDYMLDPSPEAAATYQEQLTREQQIMQRHIARLGLLKAVPREKVERLQKETQDYADSLHPLLRWSLQDKVANSGEYIRENLAHRQAIVALAQEISALNSQNLGAEKRAREQSQAQLRAFVQRLLLICFSLGLVVAGLSTGRVMKLEKRSALQRQRAEEAEREQRRLAARVVQAQEEERKRIALELHDAVGQMASALGMELSRLESAQQASPAQFREALAEVKQMNTGVVRAIKELASGLRPAMLDDLGLGPALRSHAREFSRRTGLPVDVRVEGDLDVVPEPQRTCIYRIVQEALNNCGRHAKATKASISLDERDDVVSVAIQDDGVGFDLAVKSKSGLGLIGMQERARDLGGVARITSKPGDGTRVEVALPIKEVAGA